MNENDIKIFNSSKDTDKSSAEILRSLEDVRVNRLNGNIEKARALGKLLSEISPTDDGELTVGLSEVLPKRFFVQDILYQIKILMVFACESALNFYIPITVVTDTALGSMYDRIEKTLPGFYDGLKDGAAFSFYYLAIQKGGDISSNIGEAFASLCTVKNKESFVGCGKIVWDLSVEKIRKEIERAEFTF